MLKNKTKEQLLELLYQANNENYNLQICNDKQAEILKSIANLYRKNGFFARLYNFFALPCRILQLLKTHNEYFYNISKIETVELTKEQVIKAQENILAFENKKIGTAEYSEIVTKMLGLPKNCSHCGDVAGRMHDDFQKRVNREMVEKYPELLPKPPTLKSGQFQGEKYYEWMQTYHFKGLVELLSRMKTAALNAKQRGVLEQSKIMLADCELLKAFIEARKAGQSEIEETTGVVDLGVEAIEGDLETFDIPENEVLELTEKQIEDFVNESKEDFEVAGKPEAAKEKKVYTDEEAHALKNSGMTLAELGIYYGVDTSTIQRKLKKYAEILAAKEATNETNE